MGLMYEDDVRRLGEETRTRVDKEVKEMLQAAYVVFEREAREYHFSNSLTHSYQLHDQ